MATDYRAKSLGAALRYRGREGMWTWVLHRATGLGVLLFLIVHVIDTGIIVFSPALYDEALRPSGLATTQYALLSILSRAGRPLPHGELAAKQEMAGTTLSRTLKPLTRDGLVRIVPGEDRRTRYVAITEVGEAALEEARPLWRSVLSRPPSRTGRIPSHRC